MPRSSLRRFRSFVGYASFLAIAGCGGTMPGNDASGDDLLQSDATSDVSHDAAPDVAIDAASDAIIDASINDSGVDAQPDAAPDVQVLDAGCAWDATYDYGDIGGFRAYTESSSLSPQANYTRTRTPASGTPIQCMQTVPCGTSGLLDVRAVLLAIYDSDVQAALAIGTDTLYGADARPVDGSVFSFHRASDGHSFLVGGACTGSASCRAIPAGIASLVTMLRNLDTQEIAMTGCEALR